MKFICFVVILFCSLKSVSFSANKIYDINNSTVNITANKISIDKKNNILSAKGNVNLIRGEYKITTDNIEYNRNQKFILLKNRVKIIDNKNNRIFADFGKISDDMKTGEFNNSGVILDNGTSILSSKILKHSDTIFEAKKANYCFCKNENLDLNKPYSEIKKEATKVRKQALILYANNSKIDKEKEKIYFYNIVLKLFKIPFFYIPFAYTSSAFKKNVSGFISPEFVLNTKYGTMASIGYKWFINDVTNVLLKPTVYTKGNFLINTVIDYKKEENEFNINSYYAFDNELSKDFVNIYNVKEKDEGNFKNNRFYVNTVFNKKFNDSFYFISDFKIIGDNYFLRDYLDDNSSYINSNFFISKVFENNSSIQLNGIYVKRILHNNNIYNPNLILNTRYYKSFIFDMNGDSNILLKMDYGLNNLFDSESIMYDKLTLNHSLQYNLLTNLGFFEFLLNVYSDLYTNQLNKKSEFVKNKERIIPEIAIKYQKDFILSNSLVVKPILEYYYSSDFNKNLIYYNTDTGISHLSINNIFSNNRYSGNDIMEFGNRINYGLNFLYDTYDEKIITLTIAQGFRDKKNKDYVIMNFEKKISDILFGLNIQFNDNFSIDYISTISNSNFNLKGNELLVSYDFEQLEILLSYFMSKNILNDENVFIKEEQMNIGSNYKLTEIFSLFGNFNYDIEKKRDLYTEIGLKFEENCLSVQASIRKENYVNYDGKNKWSIKFSFRLNGF